ncbi:MAG TPA: glycosyl hydrolase [Intrasporangiaceae bacterium]|nr:glycosyl hydrolase [Intrasporangiaceae bacterium]
MNFDVDEVLGRLTIEEKAALTIGLGSWQVAPIERLGIPGLTMTDGPHGVRKQARLVDPSASGTLSATCFPTASLLGATWDRDLLEEVGAALAREARAAEVDILLGPGVNIKRTPLCGRNFEYLSEDPMLSGELGAAYIRGLQGGGVDACVKHFAANNQEHRRYSVNAIIDERALREIYLPAFKAAVDAGAATVMSAYNRVGGTYATEHLGLLTHLLRGEWGFDGAVISDWGAVNDRIASLAAGMDLQMPEDGGDRVPETVAAVRAGRLPIEHLDRAARAVLGLIRRADERRRDATAEQGAGSFDPEEQHRTAARVAAAGMVLLRNEPVDGTPVLPLPAGPGAPRRIAVIGAFASEPRFQGSGSSRVVPTNVTTLRAELRKRLPDSIVRYVPGYRRHDDQDSPTLRQIAATEAAEADIAIVAVGLPESAETEGIDRRSLDLPSPHDALVRAVVRANPRTAVVVVSGAPVALPWREEVPAIVQAYLGGQAAGAAIADVVCGRADPGGRLAETFPIALVDNPVHAMPFGPRQVEYRESVYVGYRWYDTADVPVAYPFGHGLSFTTFDWTEPHLSHDRISAADLAAGGLVASVTVTNTGERAGSDVVQVYVERTSPGIFRPRRTLAGFAKVHLEPGESTRVTVPVDSAGLRTWDVSGGSFVIEDGSWKVHLSRSLIDVVTTHEVETVDGAAPHTASDCRAYHAPAADYVFSRRVFEELLDADLPDNVADRPGEYTENTPVADLLSSRSGRRLRELIATAIRRDSSGDGTVFAGDPREVALEVVPRVTMQAGLTPETVQTIVDAVNGDWRAALRDGGQVVRALTGPRRERVWRRLRGR